VKHAARFAKIYYSKLTKMQMILAVGADCWFARNHSLLHSLGLAGQETAASRTYISTTEPLDSHVHAGISRRFEVRKLLPTDNGD